MGGEAGSATHPSGTPQTARDEYKGVLRRENKELEQHPKVTRTSRLPGEADTKIWRW